MARFQLDIEDNFLQKLENMMEILGIKSKRELLGSGLSGLLWMIQMRARGFSIGAYDPMSQEVKRDFTMPILDQVPWDFEQQLEKKTNKIRRKANDRRRL